MLDFFTIFTKGGIVLWYFQNTTSNFTTSINTLIRSIVLQVRTTINIYLKYTMIQMLIIIIIIEYNN